MQVRARGRKKEKNCLTLSCFAATSRSYEVCATSFHEKRLISTELHAGRVRDVTHVQQEDKICVRTSELGGLGVFAAADLSPGEILYIEQPFCYNSRMDQTMRAMMLPEVMDRMKKQFSQAFTSDGQGPTDADRRLSNDQGFIEKSAHQAANSTQQN